MFNITKTKGNNVDYITIKDVATSSYARIFLQEGGRLETLVFKDTQILSGYASKEYPIYYASSILFPFANRIKNGVYMFNGKKYQLDCNEVGANNAIHGLVYDKKFQLVSVCSSRQSGKIEIQYRSDGNSKGFPFRYCLAVVYELHSKGINISVKVTNEDTVTFPFTIGWHPYFHSKDLYNSMLCFSANENYSFKNNNKNVEAMVKKPGSNNSFLIKNLSLDDCYLLRNKGLNFQAPNYRLNLSGSARKSFVQLYIPNKRQCIAIEPMTGAVNSFNNTIGLQTLNAGKSYVESWEIAIETKNN
ncbi:aldose 1-epimerase [Tenacibaculum sp. SG-28]|uniref:aldose 1-epimerase n=1 Tax=Tenacibaculum sp. SG-28 TaxID=754426 RepID=UPI000CF3AAB6|nr:aldose 1-epimerase [Tenacibaculum sp. SG-28]PQJ20808.1 hypothetical protein BSU00_11085 [Tenacibaculum sp. SG-28]